MTQTATWPNSDTGTGRVAQAFKRRFGKAQTNYLNRSNPYLGKINVKNDLGTENYGFIDAGYIGGAGASDAVPTSNRGFYYQPVLTPKTIQVTADIDHKARELSKQDVDAFVNGQQHTIKKLTEKYQWLRSMVHFGPGDGSLGTISTATLVSGVTWDLVITAATYQRRRFQKREVVNIGTGAADSRFTISSVTPTTATVRVVREVGGHVPIAGEKVFLQNAENAMPTSIRQGFEFTSSSANLYGIAYDELDFSPTRVDAGGATFSADMLNEMVLRMHEKAGRVPNGLYLNHRGMQRLCSSIEDRKYIDTGKTTNRVGDFGYTSLVYKSSEGEIPLMIEPNLFDSECVGIVDDMVIEHHTISGPQYVESEGGDIMHLKAGYNTYEIRYLDYLEVEVNPIYLGQIFGAATT